MLFLKMSLKVTKATKKKKIRFDKDGMFLN